MKVDKVNLWNPFNQFKIKQKFRQNKWQSEVIDLGARLNLKHDYEHGILRNMNLTTLFWRAVQF